MTSPSDVEPEFEGTLGEYVVGLLKQIQTLAEERDEARGLHEMSADSVVKLRHELVEAQANEATQIAKGLQLAAQLDEARALLQHWRNSNVLDMNDELDQQTADFLQPSNEEGPQPLRPNPTVKSI